MRAHTPTMIPPHYFPLSTTTVSSTSSSYSYYGIRSLQNAPLIEVDSAPCFASQVALKQTMLSNATAAATQYNLALPELTELAQSEAAQLIAQSLVLQNYSLWNNDLSSLSLYEMGALIPDDILILDGMQGFKLLGGQLCFPNGWTLSEKLGLPLSTIHETVPEFEHKLARPTMKLHEHLPPNRPV
jgi:Protein of unknown function (DUF3445)